MSVTVKVTWFNMSLWDQLQIACCVVWFEKSPSQLLWRIPVPDFYLSFFSFGLQQWFPKVDMHQNHLDSL